MTTYTASNGDSLVIADMVYNHLKSALAKAIRTEERMHENDPDYRNDAREAEIAAMAADLARRDAEYAAQQEAEGNGVD